MTGTNRQDLKQTRAETNRAIKDLGAQPSLASADIDPSKRGRTQETATETIIRAQVLSSDGEIRQRSVGIKAKGHVTLEDVVSGYSSLGYDVETDLYDSLDRYAHNLIDLLVYRTVTISDLTKFERNLVYRFFSRHNPIMGRIIDLHTSLPLSKIRLQVPTNIPGILRDYISTFYQRIRDRLS